MAQPTGEFDLAQYALHHVQNTHEWHLPFGIIVHLPEWLSLHALMPPIAAIVLIILFCLLYKKDSRIPSGLTNLLEVFVLFVRDQIAILIMGEEEGKRFTPLLCTFFFFILVMNLMGMIPIFTTATANINVTGALALITLSVMSFGAIQKNGLKGFFKAFVPSGVPTVILILLVPLEILGMFIKSFALMIRLFANMFGGHIVLFSILGLVGALGMVAIPSIVLAIFISLLEILVAFLQAYIFTLLSAIFIVQIHHPEH